MASRYSVTPQSLQKWKKEFLENASLAFDLSGATKEDKEEIETLKEENNALVKTLGKTTIERDWAVKKLKSLDLLSKKTLIENLKLEKEKLSLSKQCKLLEVNRTTLYSRPKPVSQKNLQILNTMDATLATDTLKEALEKYPKPKIFNSDQGSQYTSYEHTKILKDNNIEISMNGKGRSIDNIVIERFFRTLKHNYLYINEFSSIKDLKEGVKFYINKYNFKRFHSAINY